MHLMFLDLETLISRLVSSVGGPRPIVFLIGSGATMPRRGCRGVPSSSGVVESIRARLPVGTLGAGAAYQDAFQTLIQQRGQDAANAIIREAVLEACRIRPESSDDRSLAKLEADWTSWEIPDGLEALAALAAHHPASFGNTILTTNFDPLLEVALTRAGVPWHSTALHSDGSLLFLRGTGTKIVHLHGFWWGSDTLHTPRQLEANRPQLVASLKRMLADSTLVVTGYGGWQDVFTTALGNAIAGNDVSIDLLWAFHSGDEAEILRESSSLIERLSPASDRGRAHFFKDIDIDAFGTRLFWRLCEERPAETASVYLDRVLFALSRRAAYSRLARPWSTDSTSFGDFIKPLKRFSSDLPARAAIEAVKLMLPYLEAQPIHQAPDPQRHPWVREALDGAMGMLDAREPDEANLHFVTRSAEDARTDSRALARASQESIVLLAAAYALAAAIASVKGTHDLEGQPCSADYWAARAVHLIARALYDEVAPLALHLKSRLTLDKQFLPRPLENLPD